MLSVLSQCPDACIDTVQLGMDLSVPLGIVCIQCVVGGTIDPDATFELQNSPIAEEEGKNFNGVLVIFDTGAIFHSTIPMIMR